MDAATLKSSGEHPRNRRAARGLVVLLSCWFVLQTSPDANPLKIEPMAFADIIPSPPGADVTIAGPSPRSRLGGSGQADNLSDTNHSQTLAVGDFNADGIQDLAISAPDSEIIIGSAIRKAGAVYIIFGKRDLPSLIDTGKTQSDGADIMILGAADEDRFGFAIAATDVNGDGVADLIVGAPQAASQAARRWELCMCCLAQEALAAIRSSISPSKHPI
jgi:hypothetical protein